MQKPFENSQSGEFDQKSDGEKAPCYLLQRYSEEVRSVQPSNWRKFWEFSSFFCDTFDFQEFGFSVEFVVCGLSSRTENAKLFILFCDSKIEKHLKKVYLYKYLRDFNKLSLQNAFIAYFRPLKGGAAPFAKRAICRIAQRFIRYVVLRGFFNADCVYLIGVGDGEFGGRAAAYTASCIPDCFAAFYVIDADVSEYVSPQLANLPIYVQFSLSFINTENSIDQSGVEIRLYEALAENGLLHTAAPAQIVHASDDSAFEPEIVRAIAGKRRVRYPSKVTLRVIDSEAFYSFYYVALLRQSLRGGETATVERRAANEYFVQSDSGLKVGILVNELSADFNAPTEFKDAKRVLQVERLSDLRSKELLNHFLEMKGDLAFAFTCLLAIDIIE